MYPKKTWRGDAELPARSAVFCTWWMEKEKGGNQTKTSQQVGESKRL